MPQFSKEKKLLEDLEAGAKVVARSRTILKKWIRTELAEENQKPLSSASPVLEGFFLD